MKIAIVYKRLLYIIIGLICLSLVNAATYFETDFESPTYSTGNLQGQDSWAGTSSAFLAIIDDSGNQVVNTDDAGGSDVNNERSISSVPAEYEVEFKFKGDGTGFTGATVNIIIIRDASNNAGPYLRCDDDENLEAADGTTLKDIITDFCLSTSWQNVTLIVNDTAETYSVYVNDVLEASNYDHYTSGYGSADVVEIRADRDLDTDEHYYDDMCFADDVDTECFQPTYTPIAKPTDTAGLIALYDFDDNGTVAYDSSSYKVVNMTGVGITAGSGDWVTGRFGLAADLDGSTEYFEHTTPDLDYFVKDGANIRDSFAIDVWIYPHDDIDSIGSSPDQTIFDCQDSGGTAGGYWLFFDVSDTNELEIVTRGGGTVSTSCNKSDWNANQWYHILADWDTSDRMVIMVDGVVCADETHSQTFVGKDQQENRIGEYTGNNREFDGLIDDLGIYNDTLLDNGSMTCSDTSTLGSGTTGWCYEGGVSDYNVSLDSPLNDSSYVGDTNITFSFNATSGWDNSTNITCDLELDGSLNTSNEWNVSWNNSLSFDPIEFTQTTTDDVYNWSVNCSDGTNTGESINWSFTMNHSVGSYTHHSFDNNDTIVGVGGGSVIAKPSGTGRNLLPMNETSGTNVEDVINGKNWTHSGDTAPSHTNTGCKFDYCLDFDGIKNNLYYDASGVDQYYIADDYVILDLWVQPDDDWDALSGDQNLFGGLKASSGGGWLFKIDSATDQLQFSIEDIGGTARTVYCNKTAWDANTMYHVYFEWIYSGGGNWYCFIDGVASGSGTLNYDMDNNHSSVIRIGRDVNTNQFFDGTIDDWGFYSSSLLDNGSMTCSDNSTLGDGTTGWCYEGPGGDSVSNDTLGSFNGTLMGGVVNGTVGVFGEAYTFDGVDDFVNLSEPEGLDFSGDMEFSVSVWANFSNINGSHAAVVNKGDNQWSVKLNNNGSLESCAYDGDWQCAYGPVASNDTWYHMVSVYNGSTVELFVDNSSYGTASYDEISDQSHDIGIGFDEQTGNGRIFNGSIDEVWIYNYSLTPQQVSNLYGCNNVSLSSCGVADSCSVPSDDSLWELDCSDDCSFSSNVTVQGNVSITGSGTLSWGSNVWWLFNESNQWVSTGSGCTKVNKSFLG